MKSLPKKYTLTSFVLLALAPLSIAGQSLSADAFYGIAQKDLFDFKTGNKIDETDIYGVNFRFTQSTGRGVVLPGKQIISTEFFGALSLGTGSTDFSETVNGISEKVDAEILTASLLGGANARFSVSEKFHLRGDVHLGVNFTSLTVEWSFEETGTPTEKYSVGNNAFGFVYGVGIGVEYEFDKNHAFAFGVDYLASTARPKINIAYESQKMERQAHVLLSVGYKYSF